jgi:hypothetical protein
VLNLPEHDGLGAGQDQRQHPGADHQQSENKTKKDVYFPPPYFALLLTKSVLIVPSGLLITRYLGI